MRINDIEDAVIDICRDWYDRETTPLMYAAAFRSLGDGDAVIDLRALSREIEGCRDEHCSEKEMRGLNSALEILKRHIERKSVVKKITAVAAKAKKAGLDRYEFEDAFRKAWEQQPA